MIFNSLLCNSPVGLLHLHKILGNLLLAMQHLKVFTAGQVPQVGLVQETHFWINFVNVRFLSVRKSSKAVWSQRAAFFGGLDWHMTAWYQRDFHSFPSVQQPSLLTSMPPCLRRFILLCLRRSFFGLRGIETKVPGANHKKQTWLWSILPSPNLEAIYTVHVQKTSPILTLNMDFTL